MSLLAARVRWGQVWRDQLIGEGWLDARRIGLGHSAIARTEVDAVEVRPGRITRIWNAPGTHEAVWIDVPVHGEQAWSSVVTVALSKAGHGAALLDSCLESSLVEEARQSGVELVPPLSSISASCGCAEREDYCSHAVALLHAAFHEINLTPFSLLTLQGRTEEQLLADIRARRHGDVDDRPFEVDAPMDAAAAWSRPLADLPLPPRALPAPGSVPRLPNGPADSPIEPDVLHELAVDAVQRAWAMARGDGRSALDLDLDADIARRAVGLLGTTRIVELAREMDEPAQRVIGLATAWREAGSGGLALLAEPPWQPDPYILSDAFEIIVASGRRESSIVVEANTLTVADRTQYRYGKDQQWYRLDKRANHWMILTPPAVDLQDVLPVRA